MTSSDPRLLGPGRSHLQSGWWQVQDISNLMLFDASSHSSEQYLLPSAGGQSQVSRAHLVFCLSSAISTSSFSTVAGRGLGLSFVPGRRGSQGGDEGVMNDE